MFCRPFEVWQPLTQPFTPKVSCLLCSWQACLLIFHFLNFQAYFSLRNSSLASRNYSSCLTNQFDNTHRLQTSNVWCQNMSSLHPIRICFFLTLAGMADIKRGRGRGRGDLGATPKFPLPLLTPATQASPWQVQTEMQPTVIYFRHYLCVSPFMANEALLGRPCMSFVCIVKTASCVMYLGLSHIFVPVQPNYMSIICHQYMDQD